MGFLEKMRSATQAVTGGSARVSIECPMMAVRGGAPLPVRVTVVSTGSEVKSGGIFVDVQAVEDGFVRCTNCRNQVLVHRSTVNRSLGIAPAFVLGPGETRVFEGSVPIPDGQPSYYGTIKHEWSIRGRMDAFGNDPDSGFRIMQVK